MPELKAVPLPVLPPREARHRRAALGGVGLSLLLHGALLAVLGKLAFSFRAEKADGGPEVAVAMTAAERPQRKETVWEEFARLPVPDAPRMALKTEPSFRLPDVPSLAAADGPVAEPEIEDFGKPWAQPSPPQPKQENSANPTVRKPAGAAATTVAERPKQTAAGVRRSVRPVYPTSARRAGIEGTAYVKLNVGTSGDVLSARIAKSSGDARLDSAAVKAASKWKFHPATRGGVATVADIVVPIRFQLRE